MGRFPDRASEKEKRRQGETSRMIRKALEEFVIQISKLKRFSCEKENQDADEKRHVSDTRCDKSFFAGVRRRFFFEPKPNEKVRAKPHQFPGHVEHHKIFGENEGEHREHEKGKIGEKS